MKLIPPNIIMINLRSMKRINYLKLLILKIVEDLNFMYIMIYMDIRKNWIKEIIDN